MTAAFGSDLLQARVQTLTSHASLQPASLSGVSLSSLSEAYADDIFAADDDDLIALDDPLASIDLDEKMPAAAAKGAKGTAGTRKSKATGSVEEE